MNTGEDIICSVSYDPNENRPYVCRSPLKIAYTPSHKNPSYMTVALLQWVFPGLTDQKTFSISERDILFVEDASLKMVDYYYQTLEDFESVMNKKPTTKDSYESIFSDYDDTDFTEEDQQTLDEILEQLRNTRDKGKLH